MTSGDQPPPQSHSESDGTSPEAVTDERRDESTSPEVAASESVGATSPVKPDTPASEEVPAASSSPDTATQASAGSPPSTSTTTDSPPTAPDSPPAAPDSPPTAPRPKRPLGSGPLAARGLGVAKPASPSGPALDPEAVKRAAGKPQQSQKKKPKGKQHPRPRVGASNRSDSETESETGTKPKTEKPSVRSKVAVPNRRAGLPKDLEAELEAQLASADVESMLSGAAGMADRAEPLADGARVHGQVLKIHDDNVFFALGGPDEGYVPLIQFKEEPVVGQSVEVIVRGINNEDGLYILSLPGGTVDVSDWEDLEEGSVVEATVTGSNSGGLECKVGGVKGFIPISQVTEYRVEDLSDFVDQKFLCLVTEANVRRGNLVLSRRAILEREREEKRKEQLAKIEVGDLLEGTVRSIKDFGAFVDLGGLDGLIHISKLSWDRVKHPSEVLEEGQKVKVKIEKVDKDTGKISLSYRDLLENPWDTAEADYAVGSVHKGTVTRIATFGCFVKLGPGVEGLVHISELAHHRVSRVDTMVSEGEQVEVKVLSFDRDSQKIGLSIKAAQTTAGDSEKKPAEAEAEEPAREPAVKATHNGPLKGGNNRDTGGERFGLRW